VAKRGTQDGGRVGRVGLEGGPSDRMGERVSQRAGAVSTEQRGGQHVLMDSAAKRRAVRQTRRGSAPRCRLHPQVQSGQVQLAAGCHEGNTKSNPSLGLITRSELKLKLFELSAKSR
jgi:hypothetical protein